MIQNTSLLDGHRRKDEPNQLPGGVINVTKLERLSNNLIGGTLAVMIISTMNI
jgi:hypothetical protein